MRHGGLLLIAVVAFVNSTLAQLTYNELRVEYDSAWTFGNLQLVPIAFRYNDKRLSSVLRKEKPISLEEAMERSKVKVQEMQAEIGADVNWLQITNHSKEQVFIQAGEIVVGGKQDRMIGETKLIEPGTTEYVNVYCVEKGRWVGKPKPFSYGGIAGSELRKAMDVTKRQAEVWKEIDKAFGKEKKISDTWSYMELKTDSTGLDTAYLNYFLKRYESAGSELSGFVFVTDHRILSVELFISPELTGMAFRNLLIGYIKTAVEQGSVPKINRMEVRDFLDKVLWNEDAQTAYIKGHGKVDRSVNTTIHLIAYPEK